jgi:hypothetical protein
VRNRGFFDRKKIIIGAKIGDFVRNIVFWDRKKLLLEQKLAILCAIADFLTEENYYFSIDF